MTSTKSLVNAISACLVVLPERPAWSKIVQAFGPEILEKDGQLNRQRLGDIIFKDQQKRQLLNSITHPAIQKQMYRLILKAFLTGSIDITTIDCIPTF